MSRHRMGAVAVVALLLVTTAAASAASAWTPVAMSAPDKTYAYMGGVSCPTTQVCFGVGRSGNTPYATRWTAAGWTTQKLPVTPYGFQVNAVSCAPVGVCAAVGLHPYTRNTARTVAAVRRDGVWKILPTPNVIGTEGSSQFWDVSCTSNTFCVAVGNAPSTAGSKNFIARWDGTRWSLMSSPNPTTSGSQPVNSLDAVTCVSASSCLASGTTGTYGRTRVEVLRWNGQGWYVIGSPTMPSGAFEATGRDIACSDAATCTMVGEYNTKIDASTFKAFPFIARLYGGSWKLQTVPANFSPRAVQCPTSTTCTAVGATDGDTSNGDGARVFQWQGGTWTRQEVPNPATTRVFSGLSCVKATNFCNAVGNKNLTDWWSAIRR